jgi:hypothetical protein
MQNISNWRGNAAEFLKLDINRITYQFMFLIALQKINMSSDEDDISDTIYPVDIKAAQ